MAEAAQRGDVAAVKVLLKAHADVNAPQPDGTTALHWAARKADLPMVNLLLPAGANPNTMTRYGITPLWEACISDDASGAIVDSLLKAGGDAKFANPDGVTLLMKAAESGNLAVVKALLSHGADVNAKEHLLNQTALMFAAAGDHAEISDLLIKQGADVNALTATSKLPRRPGNPRSGGLFMAHHVSGGLSPLMFAAREGAIGAANVLISAGANINSADPDGFTPALVAIYNGHFDFAALLLDKGSNPNNGSLYAAVDVHNMQQGESRPAPRHADHLTVVDLIKILLARKADPNAPSEIPNPYAVYAGAEPSRLSPLQRAAQTTDVEVMRILFEAGAKPSSDGRNILLDVLGGSRGAGGGGLGFVKDEFVFRTKQKDDLVRALRLCIEHGVDVNSPLGNGASALHLAAQKGDNDAVTLLVKAGAKLDAKDRRELTPLDYAEGKAGQGGGPGGGGGRGAATAHEDTAALLRQLMKASNQ